MPPKQRAKGVIKVSLNKNLTKITPSAALPPIVTAPTLTASETSPSIASTSRIPLNSPLATLTLAYPEAEALFPSSSETLRQADAELALDCLLTEQEMNDTKLRWIARAALASCETAAATAEHWKENPATALLCGGDLLGAFQVKRSSLAAATDSELLPCSPEIAGSPGDKISKSLKNKNNTCYYDLETHTAYRISTMDFETFNLQHKNSETTIIECIHKYCSQVKVISLVHVSPTTTKKGLAGIIRACAPMFARGGDLTLITNETECAKGTPWFVAAQETAKEFDLNARVNVVVVKPDQESIENNLHLKLILGSDENLQMHAFIMSANEGENAMGTRRFFAKTEREFNIPVSEECIVILPLALFQNGTGPARDTIESFNKLMVSLNVADRLIAWSPALADIALKGDDIDHETVNRSAAFSLSHSYANQVGITKQENERKLVTQAMLDGAKFGITCAPLPIKKFKASEAFEDDVFLAIYDKNTKLVDDKNARVQGITASAIKERVRIQELMMNAANSELDLSLLVEKENTFNVTLVSNRATPPKFARKDGYASKQAQYLKNEEAKIFCTNCKLDPISNADLCIACYSWTYTRTKSGEFLHKTPRPFDLWKKTYKCCHHCWNFQDAPSGLYVELEKSLDIPLCTLCSDYLNGPAGQLPVFEEEEKKSKSKK